MDAAFETLRTEGYAGVTARSLATAADCNQAAIYYHFGGIEELLLASHLRRSDIRLERYRTAMTGEHTPSELLALLKTLHTEDVEIGHVAVLTQLLGGVAFSETLREGVVRAMQPWLDFVTEIIATVLADSPAGPLLDTSDISNALMALFLGTEMLAELDGDSDRAARLFLLGQAALQVIPESLLSGETGARQ